MSAICQTILSHVLYMYISIHYYSFHYTSDVYRPTTQVVFLFITVHYTSDIYVGLTHQSLVQQMRCWSNNKNDSSDVSCLMIRQQKLDAELTFPQFRPNACNIERKSTQCWPNEVLPLSCKCWSRLPGIQKAPVSD